MGKPSILIILGTRPEVVKMAPLIQVCRKSDAEFDCTVLATAQHRQILDKTLASFDIIPDYDLNLMKPNQTLTDVTTRVMQEMQAFFLSQRPDLVLVQGDTTTVLATSLAAFYQKIPVGHVEAGIRSGNMWAPYPEEMNRRLTDQLSSLHFAPTLQARKNLLHEGISPETIFVTGNTVIDALKWVIRKYGFAVHGRSNMDNTTILVTAHRRESFGEPLRNICQAIRLIATARPEVNMVFPVHPNPEVKGTVSRELSGLDNLSLIDPLDYPSFVQLMLRSRLILSDSGGVQEEATSLGKPVLVLRNETDRPEAIEAGHAKLVGTDPEQIFAAAQVLLDDREAYDCMSRSSDIYGDGQASERIVGIIESYLQHSLDPGSDNAW